VLLVDDTQFFREVVGGYLEAVGHEVRKVEHGAAALERLERESFDLIVSDLEMPEMDGWTLASTVRGSQEEFRTIPMVALSTLSADQAEASALASGFDAFEVKLDRTTLLATIARLLTPRAVAQRLGQEVSQ
jgi:two-component system chemotaxis sensor kinase CheA